MTRGSATPPGVLPAPAGGTLLVRRAYAFSTRRAIDSNARQRSDLTIRVSVNETDVSLSIFANALDSKHDDAARTLHRTIQRETIALGDPGVSRPRRRPRPTRCQDPRACRCPALAGSPQRRPIFGDAQIGRRSRCLFTGIRRYAAERRDLFAGIRRYAAALRRLHCITRH